MYLALVRFIGNAVSRLQGLERWKLLVAWFSVATVTGSRQAIPEKEPLDKPRCQSYNKGVRELAQFPEGNNQS